MTKTKNAAASAPEKPRGQSSAPIQSDDPSTQASLVDAETLAAEAEAARSNAEQAETKRKALEDEQARKKAKEASSKKQDPIRALVVHYAKCYPKCKEFHLTSDGQVFLSGDKSLAILHQNTLQGEGQVETINVK